MVLSLMMDIAVLLALAVTIFYAVRLSNSLNAFKSHRAEFENLMTKLASDIENAYRAIDALKEASEQMGQELQESLSDSQYMIDELRQVNEAGDSLAQRLEQLALKGRQIYAPSEAPATVDDFSDAQDVDEVSEMPSWQSTLSVKMRDDEAASTAPNGAESAAGLFSIRDPDYERGGADTAPETEFSSQAEKELYEALQRRKTAP